jgi:hypothetical protein
MPVTEEKEFVLRFSLCAKFAEDEERTGRLRLAAPP